MLRTANYLAFIFLLALFLNDQVNGQIIYDNGAGGAAGIDNGLRSDMELPEYGADDFTVLFNLSVTGVEWTGLYAEDDGMPPGTDAFTVNIYGDSGGSPGALLNSTPVGNNANRTDSGEDLLGFDVYNYSASITPFQTTPGTVYWLSIFGNTASDMDNWFWGMRDEIGNSQFSTDQATWMAVDSNPSTDFRLIGVPEPASSGIIGLMLGVFAVRRRRC